MPPAALDLLATLPLGVILVALTRADLRERRLPDRLTIPLAGLGLGLAAWRVGGWPVDEVLGAGLGLTAFWALGEAHHRLRGTEGLGLGDAKLLAAAGAWLGWRDLPPLVLVAALGALAASLPRLRAGTVVGGIAFGPWLAAAFMALWLLRVAGAGR